MDIDSKVTPDLIASAHERWEFPEVPPMSRWAHLRWRVIYRWRLLRMRVGGWIAGYPGGIVERDWEE